MTTRSHLGRGALVAAVLAVGLSCTTSEPKSDFNIDVDANQIRVALSEDVARGLMEELIGTDLDCTGDIDGGLETLLQKLDQNGPRSRATYRDGESTITARRRGGKVDLDLSGGGSGSIEATMPWAVAECLLGRTTSIDAAMTSAIKVKVTNPEGRNYSFKLD
ncbi:MAG: hypothetical protein QNL88_09890 [Acidobacteriota bacterium]|nr:hypothetical protein [Acidobacteriota bacterium]